MRFKLLVGRHSEGRTPPPKGPDGKVLRNERGKAVRGRPKVYGALLNNGSKMPGTLGNIIESKVDLCERFNKPGFPPKFEKLPNGPEDEAVYGDLEDEETVEAEAEAEGLDFESMRISELREYANVNGIDLDDVPPRKRDIIQAIRDAEKSAEEGE